MAKPMEKGFRNTVVSKKCPWCLTYLPLDATVCHACKKKVGMVSRHGMAKKPVDIKSYLVAVAAIAAFVAYIWWAFYS